MGWSGAGQEVLLPRSPLLGELLGLLPTASGSHLPSLSSCRPCPLQREGRPLDDANSKDNCYFFSFSCYS